MEGGWIRLHRKMRQWQYYQCPSVRIVFEELLLCANSSDGWFHGERVGRGETMVSVRTISKYTGYSLRIVIDALKKLTESGEIKREKCWKGIKTTIVNYEKYQNISVLESETHSETDSETDGETDSVTLSETEQEYIKKDKKEKNNIVDDARARARACEVLDELLESRITVESICKSEGVSTEEFARAAESVINEWAFTKPEHTDDSDLRSHLLSTTRIKIKELKKQRRNGTNQFTDQRQAEREQLARGLAATIARRFAEDDARAAELRQP